LSIVQLHTTFGSVFNRGSAVEVLVSPPALDVVVEVDVDDGGVVVEVVEVDVDDGGVVVEVVVDGGVVVEDVDDDVEVAVTAVDLALLAPLLSVTVTWIV
jgi:hypothetical protein